MANLLRIELLNRLFKIKNNWMNALYVHTPFCLQKCFYCVYSSKVPSSNKEMVEFYEKVIPQQIEQYKITLDNINFNQVYFGGGTPTIADADTLESIYKKMPNFKSIPKKMTEASPYTITDEHIDLFHRYRFNYVSLGVQTLSERILEKQNRLIVSKEKLNHVCRELDKQNIISNLDLIFFLDSGALEDLKQSELDLDCVMSEIRPVSITIHFNYMIKKKVEKREAMIKLIKKMMNKFNEYQCTNALLEDSDIKNDLTLSAEYRLQRKEKNFYFYMTPKIPQSHSFGYNMLALGEYQEFKPKYNYFYVYDNTDKYALLAMLRRYNSIALDFINARKKLGLDCQDYINIDNFFCSEKGEEEFKEIIRKEGIPGYNSRHLQ
jgi:coproporphyrinogen III oxidase-like Fe-S oxidoreductase